MPLCAGGRLTIVTLAYSRILRKSRGTHGTAICPGFAASTRAAGKVGSSWPKPGASMDAHDGWPRFARATKPSRRISGSPHDRSFAGTDTRKRDGRALPTHTCVRKPGLRWTIRVGTQDLRKAFIRSGSGFQTPIRTGANL